MSYFPLRKTIEDEIGKTKLSHGPVTIHVEGATPGIVIIDKNDLDNVDKALRGN